MRMHRHSIIYWSVSFCLLMVLFMTLYPTIEKNVNNFAKLLDNFPPEFIAAFNIDILTFGNALGFYAFTFVYTSLIAAIQATKYGISILSIEEREKTADFLLTKPVSRKTILFQKLLASTTSLAITNTIFFLAAYFTVSNYAGDDMRIKPFILITLSLFLVQLIFMAIGLFISMIPQKIKAVNPITMGIVFAFFIIQLFSSAFDDKSVTYFTPFKYFDAEVIIQTNRYDPVYLALTFSLIIILGGIAITRYLKKDMAQI
jgi:ABC-2 type transport system permease protein